MRSGLLPRWVLSWYPDPRQDDHPQQLITRAGSGSVPVPLQDLSRYPCAAACCRAGCCPGIRIHARMITRSS